MFYEIKPNVKMSDHLHLSVDAERRGVYILLFNHMLVNNH